MEVGRLVGRDRFGSFSPGGARKKGRRLAAKFLNEVVFLLFFCVFWVPEVYQFFIALFAVSLAADSLMSGFQLEQVVVCFG